MSKKYKIKKGDKVIVVTGKDKGKIGEVLSVNTKDDRLVVQGVNIAKKHQKPTKTDKGGLVEKELGIHISNIAYLDPKENKATKVGYRVEKDGKKVRYAKKSNEVINH